MASCRFLTERTTPLPTTVEEIQQSTRVDDDGGGGVGGGRRRRSGRRSRDEHGWDCEADVGVGDGVIRLRRREHPCGNDERGRSCRFDENRRWERRLIGGGEGMQGSKEGGRSRMRRGGEAAAADANCRGRDGDAANGEKIQSTAKETERARAMQDVDTLAKERRHLTHRATTYEFIH